MTREWDIAMGKTGTKNYPVLRLNLPRPVSIALIEAGMFRATLSVTEDGLVLKPYVTGVSGDPVELPESWK